MSYVTPDDVRAVLSPDGQPAPGSAASLDDAAIQSCIDEAQAELDARLAGRYGTPFPDDVVPPLVVIILTAVAGYLATLNYRRGNPVLPTDPVQLRYNRAQSLLAGIVSGQTPLDLANGPSDEQPVEESLGGATVVNPYEGTMFSPGQFGIGQSLRPDPFR